MIHLLDKQTDQIIAYLNKEVKSAIHDEQLSYQETFDFIVSVGDKSQFAQKRNRAIIKGEDGSYREFIILNTETNADEVFVMSNASFLDLDKQRIIEPITLDGQTLQSAATFFLNGTEWQTGIVEFSGTRKVIIETHNGAFQILKQIANLFEVEMRFRVEIKGNRIIGRFVDFYKRRGQFHGKETVFGKDLVEIRRIEDSENVVTALICLGPEREDGSKLSTIVSDDDALQRWGRDEKHLWKVYEPETEDLEMSLERLTQLGKTELNKRINSLVKYETTQAVLDNLPGLEHEKVVIADTIRVKDLHYTPPLYAEARVNRVKRNLLDKTSKEYTLGDFIEYTEDEVRKRFTDLLKIYGVKVIRNETPPEPRFGILWIDSSGPIDVIKSWDGREWVKTSPTRAEEIGAETPEGAKEKADIARDEAKEYTEQVTEPIIEQVTEFHNEITFVTGEVERVNLKANELVEEVQSMDQELKDAGGRISTLETDIDTIEGKVNISIDEISNINGVIENQAVSINAIADELEFKASKTSVDTLTGQISDVEASIITMAGQINLKANSEDVYTKHYMDSELGKKVNVTTYTEKMAQLDISVNGITSSVSELSGEIDNQGGRLDSAFSLINQQAGLIEQKVSTTDFNGNTLLSLISQSSSTIKIQAKNIELRGAVSVLSDIAGQLGEITAGVIRGASIYGTLIRSDIDNTSEYARGYMQFDKGVMSGHWGTNIDTLEGYRSILKDGYLKSYYTSGSGETTREGHVSSTGFYCNEFLLNEFAYLTTAWGLTMKKGTGQEYFFRLTGELKAGATTLGTTSTGALTASSLKSNVYEFGNNTLRYENGVLSAPGGSTQISANTLKSNFFEFGNNYFRYASGYLTAPGGSLSISQNIVQANVINQTSNANKKKNIVEFEKNVLEDLLNTTIREFHYKNEDDENKKHIGIITQEAPNEVVNDDDSSVNLGSMIGFLWKGIIDFHRQYSDEIQLLKRKIEILEEM